MMFNLEETEKVLREVIKVDRGFPITWVKSMDGIKVVDKHRYFEVALFNPDETIGIYAVVSIEVPNHETAIHLLKRVGTLTSDLIESLESSFTESEPKLMVVSAFHDDWANERINVKHYLMS